MVGLVVSASAIVACSTTTASEAPITQDPVLSVTTSTRVAPPSVPTRPVPPAPIPSTQPLASEPPVPVEPAPVEPVPVEPVPVEPVPVETLPVPEVSVLERPLVAVGESNGIETARIQLRLIEIGFWVSHFDGKYGHTTRQGVMAFQKYAGLEATGVMDEQTALALTIVNARPLGRTTDPGVVVEIDKDRQLLFMIVNGRLEWAINISSGSGQYYLEPNQKDPTRWESGRSLTPSGRFVVNRERPEGWWSGDLGEIYRPKYFNGGIAIHGSRSIPHYPASHGCVRVSTAAMDMIWATGLVPKNTAVWVYGDDVPARGEPPVLPPPVLTPPVTDEPPFSIPNFNFTL